MAILSLLILAALGAAAARLTGHRRSAAVRLLSGVLMGLALAQTLATIGIVR